MKPRTAWTACAPSGQENISIGVPSGIQVVVAIRPDLKHLNLSKVTDRILLFVWWERQLQHEYRELDWSLSERDCVFLMGYSVQQFCQEGGRGLSMVLNGNWSTMVGLMPGWRTQHLAFVLDEFALLRQLPAPLQLIWNDRPDLQDTYPVHTTEGRFAFLGWWSKFGQHEYPRVRWSLDPTLGKVQPHAEDRWPLPRYLTFILSGRHDLSPQLYAPVSDSNWVNALLWWHLHGAAEFAIEEWRLERQLTLRRMMHQRVIEFNSIKATLCPVAETPIPYVLYLIWSTRSDLPTLFDIKTLDGCRGLLAWWNQNRLAEYGSFPDLFGDPERELPGLNIIGYAQSVIGIAEDVRMAVRAAEIAGISFNVIDAPMPGPAKSDRTLDAHLTEKPNWPVSLICLPPTEIIRLGMEGGRRLVDGANYVIGAWHWELPVWPDHLMGVIDSVDEIWVFSDFVRNAFHGKTQKTVRKMPLAVELPASHTPARERFGLSPNKFYYLIMFDGNSWLSRKNPLAAVRAFRKAFPDSHQVGLVIKAISLNRQSEDWLAVEKELQGDERVVVIDQTLDRVSLVQLMASCDAYVSLHRSEGFGRIIAESMLLGKPTITTAFSGNLEFCRKDTSFLVEGPMAPLTPQDYIFWEGQYWCDPDILQAAEQMVRVFEDRPCSKGVANLAQQLIQSEYSVKAVAHAYRQRLRELRSAGSA